MLVDIQRKFQQALGSVKDQVSVCKATLQNHNAKSFTQIEVAVVRATGHYDGVIDDNHVNEIFFLVCNTPGSSPFLAERISRRLAKTRNPFVAMKTLLLIHRLLRGGNHGFEQELRKAYASGYLQLRSPWLLQLRDPCSSFLKNYAFYLEERIGWRINQGGKLEPVMCSGLKYRRYEEKMVDMVFRKLPRCQEFIEMVLNCSDFDSSPLDILVETAIKNTLKESFQVYNTYCDGVSALMDMFFDLATPAKRIACDILKLASRQSRELQDLYDKSRRAIGSKSLDYPWIQPVVVDQITVLEQCSELDSIESSSSKTQAKRPSFDLLPTSDESNTVAEEGEDDEGQAGLTFFSSSPFAWTMETKISSIWVAFEDDGSNYL